MERVRERTIISAEVEAEQRDALKQLAREHERSLSGEVRKAIGLYLRIAGNDDTEVRAA
jgi:hypothetical protein